MTDQSEPSEPAVAADGDASAGDDGDEPESEDDGLEYLDDVEDGAGCAEIWERLSERREAARDEAERDG